ncbi:MAG: site-specific DNA-methyltransferase, partial [Caldanaerobacter sp.]
MRDYKLTLFDELKELLKEDERFISTDNKLLRNIIIEMAVKLDKDFIKLLLKNDKIREQFFKDIDGILVFDKEKFVKFMSNKRLLPDSYTSFKNKIGLMTGKEYISNCDEVVLVWPFKDCILEGGQEKTDEEREEIFHNEILAPDEIDRLLEPKVFTNFKRINKDGEHEVIEIKPNDNLIIKGNNLLALHSLKKRYAGKIKLIYIDPPYNTGSDEFRYNDNFNHSTWLTFMKNRLEVAKELLKEDGIIFVQIDNRELAYLKVLMDEIFCRDNFLAMITLKTKAPGGVGQESFLFDICEYILIYAKDKDKVKNYTPFVETELDDNYKDVYNKILEDLGKEQYIKEINGGNVGTIKLFKHENFKIRTLSKSERTIENYLSFFDKIFRTTNPQGGLMKRVLPQIPKKGLFSIEYIPTKGKSAGENYRYYFLDGSLIVWLKDSAIRT